MSNLIEKKSVEDDKSTEKISTHRKVFYAFTIIFGLYCIPFVYFLVNNHLWSYNNFKTDEERAHMIHITDFGIMLASGTLMIFIRAGFIRLSYPFFYHYCKEQNIEQLRHKRSIKASECSFKFFYFSAVTIYGFYILKDIDWFPWYLGGSGDMINGFTDMPQFTYRPGIKMFSLFTMGYHVLDLFHHIFIKERSNDYEEMLLHHVCTVILYATCVSVNNYVAGCPIMFLHDVTDILIALSRMIAESKVSFLGVPFFVSNTFAWFYFRSICFPHIIYTLHNNWTFAPELEIQGQAIRWSVTCFLSCLAFLHLYWFGLFISIILHYSKTGKADDAVNKIKLNEKEANAIVQSKKQA